METIREILSVVGVEEMGQMDVGDHYTIERDVYEDLTIEMVGEDRLSVSQHYTQQGDLMRDPEIVFETSGDEWTAVMFQQDPTVFKRDEDGLPTVEHFAESWSENLRKQGFVEAAQEE